MRATTVRFLALLCTISLGACADDTDDGGAGDGSDDGYIRADFSIDGGESFSVDEGAKSSTSADGTVYGCEGRDADHWGIVISWNPTTVVEPGVFESSLLDGTALWMSRPDPIEGGLTVGSADGTITFTTVDYDNGEFEGTFEGLYERDDPDDTISVTIMSGEFGCTFD